MLKEGYVYYIDEKYFANVNDNKLMINKGNSNRRPCLISFRDAKTGLIWVVPMSTQIEKFRAIEEKQKQRYGKSLGVYICDYCGKDTAFLIQNAFPVLDKYFIDLPKNIATPYISEYDSRQVKSRLKKTLVLSQKGHSVMFTDIRAAEQKMFAERAKDRSLANQKAIYKPITTRAVKPGIKLHK